MISRQWRGLAKASEADRYVQHLQAETFPLLSTIKGFVEASILRRNVSEGVEFLVVTRWESMNAIRQFAGVNAEQAVVPDNVVAMMVRYDDLVAHYEEVGWS
jgi:heme-degrading monooxygenase HmoA